MKQTQLRRSFMPLPLHFFTTILLSLVLCAPLLPSGSSNSSSYPQLSDESSLALSKAIKGGNISKLSEFKEQHPTFPKIHMFPNSSKVTPLQWAAISNNLTSLQYFLALGADPNYKVPDNYSDALGFALCKESTECVHALINHGANRAQHLVGALWNDNEKVVELLLRKKPKLSEQEHQDVLDTLMENNDAATLEKFHHRGLLDTSNRQEVNWEFGGSSEGDDASSSSSTQTVTLPEDDTDLVAHLIYSVETTGDIRNFFVMLKARAQQKRPISSETCTELLQLLINRNLSTCVKIVCDTLLQSEVACQQLNPTIDTALEAAIQADYVDCLRILLDADCRLSSSQQPSGMNELHRSVIAQRIQCAIMLLEKGFDANAKTTVPELCSTPITPLIMASCSTPVDPAMIELLLRHGAHTDCMDNQHNTPLHHVCQLLRTQAEHTDELLEAARLLISYGADEQARNNYEKTPLELAREVLDTDQYRMLTQMKVDPALASVAKNAGTTVPPSATGLAILVDANNLFALKRALQNMHDTHPKQFTPELLTALLSQANKNDKQNSLIALLQTRDNPEMPRFKDTALQCVNTTWAFRAAKEAQMHGCEKTLQVIKECLKPQRAPESFQKNASDIFTLGNLIINGDHEALAQLLEENPALARVQFSSKNETALMIAASYWQADCVQVLLQAESDPNYENGLLQNAIHMLLMPLANSNDPTSVNEFARCLELLTQAGCNINAMDNNGRQPLHYIALFGRSDLFDVAVHYGARHQQQTLRGKSIKDIAQKQKHQAFLDHYSQFEESLEHIKGLIEDDNSEVLTNLLTLRPAMLRCTVKAGMSPFLYAASKGALDCMAKIMDIARGTDYNPLTDTNQSGSNALYLAIEYNHHGAVQYLTELGADLEKENGFKATPLVLAITHQAPSILQLLLERGADPNNLGNAKRAPLLIATTLEDHDAALECAKILLEHGADPNMQATGGKDKGATPLILACQNSHKKLLPLLLSYGADKNIRDADNNNASYYAGRDRSLQCKLKTKANQHLIEQAKECAAQCRPTHEEAIEVEGLGGSAASAAEAQQPQAAHAQKPDKGKKKKKSSAKKNKQKARGLKVAQLRKLGDKAKNTLTFGTETLKGMALLGGTLISKNSPEYQEALRNTLAQQEAFRRKQHRELQMQRDAASVFDSYVVHTLQGELAEVPYTIRLFDAKDICRDRQIGFKSELRYRDFITERLNLLDTTIDDGGSVSVKVDPIHHDVIFEPRLQSGKPVPAIDRVTNKQDLFHLFTTDVDEHYLSEFGLCGESTFEDGQKKVEVRIPGEITHYQEKQPTTSVGFFELTFDRKSEKCGHRFFRPSIPSDDNDDLRREVLAPFVAAHIDELRVAHGWEGELPPAYQSLLDQAASGGSGSRR